MGRLNKLGGERLAPKNEVLEMVWMFIAEVFGSFIYIIISLGAAPGLGDGAGVAAAFQIVGHVSFAHVNPAVTVACVLYSHIHWITGLSYIFAEFIGALLGTFFVWFTNPIHNSKLKEGEVCTALSSIIVSLSQIFCSEFITTLFYVMNYGVAYDEVALKKKKMESVPMRMGAVTYFLAETNCLLSGVFQMNPWKGFFTTVMSHHSWLAYISGFSGSFIGSALGAIIYRGIFRHELFEDYEDEETNEENA